MPHWCPSFSSNPPSTEGGGGGGGGNAKETDSTINGREGVEEARARMTVSKQAAACRHVMHKGEAIRAGLVKGVFTPALIAVGGEVGKAPGTDVCVVELLLTLLLLSLLLLYFFGTGFGAFSFSFLFVVVIQSIVQESGEQLSHLGLFVLDNKGGGG